jgi:hypothetical protein
MLLPKAIYGGKKPALSTEIVGKAAKMRAKGLPPISFNVFSHAFSAEWALRSPGGADITGPWRSTRKEIDNAIYASFIPIGLLICNKRTLFHIGKRRIPCAKRDYLL